MKCEQCEIEHQNRRFCSLSCAAKWGAAQRQTLDPQGECLRCKTAFSLKKDNRKKFCTRQCWIKYTKEQAKSPKETRRCSCCDTPISRGSRTCSPCQGALRKQQLVRDWLAGTWDGCIKTGLSKTIRDYLIVKAKYKCPRCGWGEVNEFTGNVPLQIDHLDGDAYNNHPANLQVTCWNCHSLTKNFGALNRNSTRKYRYGKLVEVV